MKWGNFNKTPLRYRLIPPVWALPTMKKSIKDINANDVNGTPDDYTDRSVASGTPPIVQVGVGRHPATGPEDGGYQASSAAAARSTTGRPYEPNRRKRNVFIGDPVTFTKYYSIKSTNGADLTKINLLKADRELSNFCGELARLSIANNRMLTVEVKNANQGTKLESLQTLVNEQIEVHKHETYNQSQGVLTCSLLKPYSDEEIVDGLSHLGVIKAYRISKKNDSGNLEPTSSIILTFNTSNLPDRIRIIAELTERIRPYIPLPKRCFNFQQYGHMSRACRRQTAICERCGEVCTEDHTSRACPNDPSCTHCGGPHGASNRNYERYLFEKEIIAVKIKQNLIFMEARHKVLSQLPSGHALFSSVVRRNRQTSSTPTANTTRIVYYNSPSPSTSSSAEANLSSQHVTTPLPATLPCESNRIADPALEDNQNRDSSLQRISINYTSPTKTSSSKRHLPQSPYSAPYSKTQQRPTITENLVFSCLSPTAIDLQ